MAAAGISRDTEAIAIVVSQTSGSVRVFRRGKAALELAPRVRRSYVTQILIVTQILTVTHIPGPPNLPGRGLSGYDGGSAARASLVALMIGDCPSGRRSRRARADDAQKARDLFTQGNTFFDLGQFDQAIDAWQKGYQLKNDPGFLYNIAQAYRMMGDAQKAIFFYKRYLSNAPKAHNRVEVEQKIEALQKQLSAQDQAKQISAARTVRSGQPGAGRGAAPAEPTSPPAATAPPSAGHRDSETPRRRTRGAGPGPGDAADGGGRAAAAPDRPGAPPSGSTPGRRGCREGRAVVRLHAGRRLHLWRARGDGSIPAGRAASDTRSCRRPTRRTPSLPS